jgi:ankyrin repeat protein
VTNKQPKRRPRPGVDEYGRTPLHYAVIERNLAAVKDLLAAGGDPSVCDDDGWTPLHFAAQEYAPDICAALLSAGAPVDVRDSQGNTPLFRAVFDSRGRGEVIRVLRAHGASPTLANARGSHLPF